MKKLFSFIAILTLTNDILATKIAIDGQIVESNYAKPGLGCLSQIESKQATTLQQLLLLKKTAHNIVKLALPQELTINIFAQWLLQKDSLNNREWELVLDYANSTDYKNEITDILLARFCEFNINRMLTKIDGYKSKKHRENKHAGFCEQSKSDIREYLNQRLAILQELNESIFENIRTNRLNELERDLSNFNAQLIINMADEDERTAAMAAAAEGKLEALKLCQRNGADIKRKGRFIWGNVNFDKLKYLVLCNTANIVYYLVALGEVSISIKVARSKILNNKILFLATYLSIMTVSIGLSALLSKLVGLAPIPAVLLPLNLKNIKDSKYETAQSLAQDAGHTEVVEYLKSQTN